MAAERGEMIFKSCVDSDHVTRPDGMMDHGHFCIPVLAHGALLGLMNLYLPHGHQPGKDELSFLESVAGAVANIIQNKQMEAKADKIFKAINQAGEAVLITDSNGVIEYVNQAYCTTTGYSEAEAIGQNPSMLNSGKQNRAFYDQIWGTITSGQVWQGEITEKRKDGSTYPAMLTISPIRDSEGEGEGEITHFVGIHEDLSEHKALEAQFRQAQKMEALGTLVGGIAHDFNNMLAGMIGNLFLIKKKMEGMPELQERVEQVETVGFQAADIIKQMMVFARSEQVEKGLVSFTALIKELFRLHQIVISEHILLEKTIIGQKLDIKGDATQLQQLLLNLFGNAVDAVRERESPVITLLLEPFYADQAFCSKYKDAEIRDYAHLMVRDNGYGIEQKNLENIFDPFFTTKEVGRGTGLGLSMSSTIVKSHGGFIRVESESGVGTEFHVYIPLVEGIAGTRDSGKIEDTVTGRGELVLIADDNSALRHSTAEALESLGYRTVLAENGRQAVDIYRSNAVSVILFDVVMPEMGGPEAAREILAFDPAANIIFATGYDKSASLPELKGIESIPLLSKPFQIQELSRIIRLLLD